jgi:hypothetical protein
MLESTSLGLLLPLCNITLLLPLFGRHTHLISTQLCNDVYSRRSMANTNTDISTETGPFPTRLVIVSECHVAFRQTSDIYSSQNPLDRLSSSFRYPFVQDL